MRGKSTRGYVLKVAVASASIGCATLTACESQHPPGHPVGTVASPPGAMPDAIDGGATPEPTVHKVGIIARPPDDVSPTVGTTAHAPDSKP